MKSAYDIVNSLDKRSTQLLNIIHKCGPVTKAKLESMTKMKKSTLNRGLEALHESLAVTEISAEESTGGRKPSLFSVNEKLFYLVGVDISRTYIQIVLTNLRMDVIEEKIIYGTFTVSQQGDIIIKGIRELLEKVSIHISNIIGIGLGVVVPILQYDETDENNGLKKLLMEKFKLPVFLDNGANTALLAEYNFGIGREKKSIAYVHCGVGIRTAVISNGNIVRTINNSEDAFGHMIIDIKGDLCYCGNYGCVESYTSISKINSKYISEIKKGRKTKLEKPLEEINYIDVCNLAENDDDTAKNIILDASIYFGTGLANFIKMLAPEMIILSGPLIKHSPLFYENSKKIAMKKCSPANTESIEFYRGGFFENKSIAIGAAYLALNEILNNKLRE